MPAPRARPTRRRALRAHGARPTACGVRAGRTFRPKGPPTPTGRLPYLGEDFNVRQLMLRAVHPQVLELPYNTREEDLRGLPEQPLSRSAKKLRLRKKQGQKRKFSAS